MAPFSPTLEIPAEFLTWYVLVKLSALPSSRYARRRHYATNHTQSRWQQLKESNIYQNNINLLI